MQARWRWRSWRRRCSTRCARARRPPAPTRWRPTRTRCRSGPCRTWSAAAWAAACSRRGLSRPVTGLQEGFRPGDSSLAVPRSGRRPAPGGASWLSRTGSSKVWARVSRALFAPLLPMRPSSMRGCSRASAANHSTPQDRPGFIVNALSRYECAAARHAATLTARLQLRLRAVVPCRVAAAAAQCAWLYGRQRRTFFVTMRMTESGQVLRRAVVCCRAAARRACAAHAVCWGPCSACGCSHLWPGLGAVGARIKARGSHPGGACDAPWSTGSCRRIQGRLGSASCSGAAADARAARAGVHDGAGIPAVHRVLAGGRGRLPRARLGLYPRGAGGARPAMQHALFSSRV